MKISESSLRSMIRTVLLEQELFNTSLPTPDVPDVDDPKALVATAFAEWFCRPDASPELGLDSTGKRITDKSFIKKKVMSITAPINWDLIASIRKMKKPDWQKNRSMVAEMTKVLNELYKQGFIFRIEYYLENNQPPTLKRLVPEKPRESNGFDSGLEGRTLEIIHKMYHKDVKAAPNPFKAFIRGSVKRQSDAADEIREQFGTDYDSQQAIKKELVKVGISPDEADSISFSIINGDV